MNGQAALNIDARSPNEKYADEYRAGLAKRAQETGRSRAIAADADGYEEALELIRDLAQSGEVFSADDVRARQRIGSPAVLGPAFKAARREGLIEPVGVDVSANVSQHGGLLRAWRGVW